jgi:hypothetical protein
MDWKHGSSSRAPTLQVQSSEFKPQSHQKKKMEVGASLLCRGQALVSWLHDSLSLSLPLMQCRAHLLSSHRVDGIAHRIFT